MIKELLHQILQMSGEFNSSDIHLVEKAHPVFRINGMLQQCDRFPVLTRDTTKEISQYIMEELCDTQFFDQKEIDAAFSIEGLGRYRLNIYKERGSYALALRALPNVVKSMRELDLPTQLDELCDRKRGLILVTGPTGSGKSTTLAAMINEINRNKRCHIITIEDPVEYLYEHDKAIVNQREVGADSGSFADALRAAMREDPDIILVGEMRDPETIQTALTAAETGHLVFSTLHTTGAAKTVDRIIDTFESGKQNQIAQQLATVLQAVISQVLIPRADGKGRIMSCEIMKTTPAIQNLIRERKPHQIRNSIQSGVDIGMQLLDNDLIRLARLRVIDRTEAISYAQDSEYVSRNLTGIGGV